MYDQYRSIISKIIFKELTQFKRFINPNKPPSNLIWFLTERCNLSCSHCFVSHKDRIYRDELKFENIKNILDTSNGNINSIVFTGGEPLLYKDFEKTFMYASSIPSIQRLHVSTNGLRANELFNIFENSIKFNTKLSIQSSIVITSDQLLGPSHKIYSHSLMKNSDPTS